MEDVCGGLGGLVVSAAFDFMLGEFNIMNDIVHAEMSYFAHSSNYYLGLWGVYPSEL